MSKTARARSLTRKQLSLIHVAKAKLGLTDGEYRDLLESATRVRSAKEINPADFPYLMERFGELGFTSDYAAGAFGHREQMATPNQVTYIRDLWRTLHGGELDERHLDNWIMDKFKVSALRFVNFQTAQKAITALKAWQTREDRKRASDRSK